MDKKFIDLEIKIAYLEKTVDDLNKVIIDQQHQITALQEKLDEVDEKVKHGEANEIINPPPPHH
jgi:SlyX protein